MSGRMGEWSLKLPYEGKPIRLQPSMIFVGRSECDIVVNSTTVDKRHAVIYFNQQDQQFHIKDLNTLSGTFVNGTRIPEQSYVKLEHGDQIRFGYHKQNFEMQLVGGEMPTPTPTPTTPMEDDDSLNETKTNSVGPLKGMDSLEDVSPANRRASGGPNPAPQPGSPSSPRSEETRLPPKDLPLKNMVSSFCAPVRSPSEPQIDNRMVASLWDSQEKSPARHKTPTRRPPAVAMIISAEPSVPRSNNQKVTVHCANPSEETNGHEKAKAFVINFEEPKRRASIPQSVLQRRQQAARNKEEECRVSEDSTGTNGNLSESANFLIQKMLQSNDDLTTEAENDARERPAEEDDHRSETGTYTVDDPQAREARRNIDMVFGVEEEAFNQYNGRSKTMSRTNKQAVAVTRTRPIVAPAGRNRAMSSSTFMASSVPTPAHIMSESMVSSTISSGSSTGGLPSKPSSMRNKPVAVSARQNRRPSSSGLSRPPTGKATPRPPPAKETTRPTSGKTLITSALRRGPYGGSDFSLESSDSSGSHLTAGESMRVNRTFALRRARLGLQDNVASQKSHLLTGSNPNLFSRQDGGRFSMRILSSKQRTRPGMENPQHGSGVTEAPNRNSSSPKARRRNGSDPCNINILGEELDDADDLSRPELRSQPHRSDPLSQSTLEPSTQDHDVLKDSEMCRSASFNAHPRAASPLLLRKETFLKQRTSPQHQALEAGRQRAATVAPARPNLGGSRPSSQNPSPSRATFSPQLQRRTMGSPQVTRKVLPSPQASPHRHQPQNLPQQLSHEAQSFYQAKASLGEKDEPQGLSALDQLVIQAISQLSGKLRLRVGSLMERESKRYPEGSDQSLLITELLSAAVAPPPAITESIEISKELSSILRNLRNIETSVNTLLALEPAPPVVEEKQTWSPPQAEETPELPDAESLGDTVPRGFFTVAI